MTHEPDPYHRRDEPTTAVPMPGEQYQQDPGYPPQPGYPVFEQPGYFDPYAPPGYSGYPQYGYAVLNPPPQNGFGTAGMVLGIVSLPSLCTYIGPLVAIVGGILSAIGLSKARNGAATNKGMAIAGLVLAGVSLLLFFVFFTLVAVSFFLEDGFDTG